MILVPGTSLLLVSLQFKCDCNKDSLFSLEILRFYRTCGEDHLPPPPGPASISHLTFLLTSILFNDLHSVVLQYYCGKEGDQVS